MGRGTPMAAASARRVRFLLSGVLALAVLTGGSLYLARGEFFPGPARRRPEQPAPGPPRPPPRAARPQRRCSR